MSRDEYLIAYVPDETPLWWWGFSMGTKILG